MSAAAGDGASAAPAKDAGAAFIRVGAAGPDLAGPDLSGVDFAWVEGAGALGPLRDDWLALMARTGADVHFDPDWIAAWAAGPGAGIRLLCLTARRGGRLAALLPFALGRVGPLRLARPAGTDPNAVLMRLPAEDDLAAPALAVALARLLGPEGCAGASFTPVSDAFPAAAAIRAACVRAGAALHDEAAGGHTVFRLPESFEAYLAALSKKRRNQFRRDLRQLGEGRALENRSLRPSRADFDAFRAFHDGQWQASGRGGHFGDWPDAAAFHGALTATLAPRGVMRLEDLRDGRPDGGDVPLSTQLCYVSGGVCWWRLPARSLDPDCERLGVGRIGLVLMIERMIGEGVRLIEGGAGDYDYKRIWGGETAGLRRMIAAPAGGRGRGVRALLGWARLVDLLYYRGWFLKLAPRLARRTGMQRRPLWRVWIRSRI